MFAVYAIVGFVYVYSIYRQVCAREAFDRISKRNVFMCFVRFMRVTYVLGFEMNRSDSLVYIGTSKSVSCSRVIYFKT